MTPEERSTQNDDLDGHTMEQLALSNMKRFRELSWSALERESHSDPDRDNTWITGLLETIRAEIRSGRDIPISHPDPALRLTITEAAVRGIIRRAGDTLGGVIMGRCVLDGDVTIPGEGVRVDITASIEFGRPVNATAELLRQRVAEALAEHTELLITKIDVVIDGVYPRERPLS